MRRDYKEAIRLSVEAAERLSIFKHHLQVHFSDGETDENGSTVYFFGVNQPPSAILKAITIWDETAEL